MPLHPRERAPMPISNGLGRGVDQNYGHLSLLVRTSSDKIGT